MRKLLILAICLILGMNIFAYEWEPYGPPGITAYKIHIFEQDFVCALFTYSGFYLSEELYSPTWMYSDIKATGAASYNADSILIILSDGSYSDGIYVMDVNTQEYDVLTYCEWPNFILKIHGESHYFVGFKNGLLESLDGKTWTEVNSFSGIKCLDMASCDDMMMVAVEYYYNNAFVSFDQGSSWDQVIGWWDYKTKELAGTGHYGMNSTIVGIFEQDPGDGPGLYEFDGTQWEPLYLSYDIAELGADIFHSPLIGWNYGTPPDVGIGIYQWNSPNAGLHFLNNGLPDQNIVDIGKNGLLGFVGASVVFCITESGSYVCRGVGVGLDQVSQEDQNIEVFPNPVNDILNIQLPAEIKENSNINLYDCSGNILLDREISGLKSAVDISVLPSGLYILKVLDASGKLIGAEKIIKH